MKIAVLSDSFYPYSSGGAERVAFRLARQYVRLGHDVFVITTVQNRQHEGQYETDGMKVYALYAQYHDRWRAYLSLYNPQTIAAVRKILSQNTPSLIHAHNIHWFLSYYCLKAAHDMAIPVILTVHDAMSFDFGKFTQFIDQHDLSQDPEVNYKINPWTTMKAYRFRYFPLRNFTIRYCLHRYITIMVAVSNELKIALNANGIRCNQVVHNGIDLQALSADPAKVASFKKAYELENKKVILFAGRVSYLKGAQHIINAMKYVCEQVPTAVLLVAGSKEGCEQRMKELFSAERINNKIIFTGWLSREDMLVAYTASDLVISPSICWDSFPTVNLEAMAMKKPVIATCFGGSKELVVDSVTGYIVNPFNITLMADKIIEILTDDNRARAMGDAGYQRITGNFTIQAQTKKMLDLFSMALHRKNNRKTLIQEGT